MRRSSSPLTVMGLPPLRPNGEVLLGMLRGCLHTHEAPPGDKPGGEPGFRALHSQRAPPRRQILSSQPQGQALGSAQNGRIISAQWKVGSGMRTGIDRAVIFPRISGLSEYIQYTKIHSSNFLFMANECLILEPRCCSFVLRRWFC